MDELDKDIVQCLSTGACSYQEIARICNVTRNTIYRRIEALEKKGIIKAATSCIISLDKIGIMPIIVGAKAARKNMDYLLHSLQELSCIRMLWRTYGDLDINLVAFCSPGQEGQSIEDIRSLLEEANCEKIVISIGFSWEKSELSPFESPIFQSELTDKSIRTKDKSKLLSAQVATSSQQL